MQFLTSADEDGTVPKVGISLESNSQVIFPQYNTNGTATEGGFRFVSSSEFAYNLGVDISGNVILKGAGGVEDLGTLDVCTYYADMAGYTINTSGQVGNDIVTVGDTNPANISLIQIGTVLMLLDKKSS